MSHSLSLDTWSNPWFLMNHGPLHVTAVVVAIVTSFKHHFKYILNCPIIIRKRKWELGWHTKKDNRSLVYLYTDMDKPDHLIKKPSARSNISAVHNEFTIPTIKGCEEGTLYNNRIKDWSVLALESSQQNVLFKNVCQGISAWQKAS